MTAKGSDMTRKRRRAEHDFWLHAAELADGPVNAGLCAAVGLGSNLPRLRAKNIFEPDGGATGFWGKLPHPQGCNIMPEAGPKGGRVLAALLLAAMAATGDLDWTFDEEGQ